MRFFFFYLLSIFQIDQDLKHVYETYKSSDGFLYLSYYESASLG